MSDETKPQDSAAIPPASAGSHGEPVAWLIHADGWQMVSLFREHADSAAEENDAEVSPLYLHPQPTLTNREIESLEWAAITASESLGHAEAIRGLLERLDN